MSPTHQDLPNDTTFSQIKYRVPVPLSFLTSDGCTGKAHFSKNEMGKQGQKSLKYAAVSNKIQIYQLISKFDGVNLMGLSL